MKGPLGISGLIAVVVMLAAAGCGRSGPIAFDPEGGRIEFEVYVTNSSNNLYDTWEFCWEGFLDTAQGSTPGDDETVRTFQNIPGHQGTMISPVSEELRAGAWRLRVRLTGFAPSGSAVAIDLNDCTNSNGDRPAVFSGKTTRVIVQQGYPRCEWIAPSSGFTPNMPDGVVQPCSPGVSRLAVPRRLG